MALQSFGNFHGGIWSPAPPFGFSTSTSNLTVDAAGESVAIVGHINLSTGPGTSKTLDSNGKIHWLAGTVTFANAGTTLRVGVNDVGATGLEDGTHDVYKDLVGGTDTITGGGVVSTQMATGSKSITHGDLVAIVLEMTARGGADSIVVVRSNTNGLVTPHGTNDVGAGPVKGLFGAPFICIEFGDGTVGWMDSHVPGHPTLQSPFGNASSPDEHALVFQVPFKANVSGLAAWLGSLAATDDFEMILYSDPLGTPVAERTLSHDMDIYETNQIWARPFTSVYTLEPNTNYAIALRPFTVGALSYYAYNFGAGNGNLRKATPVGTHGSLYTRSDQTGAFGNQSLIVLPLFGLRWSAFDDAAGSGTTIAGTPMRRGMI